MTTSSQWLALGAVVAAGTSPAALAQTVGGPLPPLVEAYPAARVSIRGDYECEPGRVVTIELEKRGDAIGVRRLSGFGRSLSASDRDRMNRYLRALDDLSHYEVGCSGAGITLTVSGKRRGERAPGSVSLWWSESGVRSLDFDRARR